MRRTLALFAFAAADEALLDRIFSRHPRVVSAIQSLLPMRALPTEPPPPTTTSPTTTTTTTPRPTTSTTTNDDLDVLPTAQPVRRQRLRIREQIARLIDFSGPPATSTTTTTCATTTTSTTTARLAVTNDAVADDLFDVPFDPLDNFENGRFGPVPPTSFDPFETDDPYYADLSDEQDVRGTDDDPEEAIRNLIDERPPASVVPPAALDELVTPASARGGAPIPPLTDTEGVTVVLTPNDAGVAYPDLGDLGDFDPEMFADLQADKPAQPHTRESTAAEPVPTPPAPTPAPRFIPRFRAPTSFDFSQFSIPSFDELVPNANKLLNSTKANVVITTTTNGVTRTSVSDTDVHTEPLSGPSRARQANHAAVAASLPRARVEHTSYGAPLAPARPWSSELQQNTPAGGSVASPAASARVVQTQNPSLRIHSGPSSNEAVFERPVVHTLEQRDANGAPLITDSRMTHNMANTRTVNTPNMAIEDVEVSAPSVRETTDHVEELRALLVKYPAFARLVVRNVTDAALSLAELSRNVRESSGENVTDSVRTSDTTEEQITRDPSALFLETPNETNSVLDFPLAHETSRFVDNEDVMRDLIARTLLLQRPYAREQTMSDGTTHIYIEHPRMVQEQAPGIGSSVRFEKPFLQRSRQVPDRTTSVWAGAPELSDRFAQTSDAVKQLVEEHTRLNPFDELVSFGDMFPFRPIGAVRSEKALMSASDTEEANDWVEQELINPVWESDPPAARSGGNSMQADSNNLASSEESLDSIDFVDSVDSSASLGNGKNCAGCGDLGEELEGLGLVSGPVLSSEPLQSVVTKTPQGVDPVHPVESVAPVETGEPVEPAELRGEVVILTTEGSTEGSTEGGELVEGLGGTSPGDEQGGATSFREILIRPLRSVQTRDEGLAVRGNVDETEYRPVLELQAIVDGYLESLAASAASVIGEEQNEGGELNSMTAMMSNDNTFNFPSASAPSALGARPFASASDDLVSNPCPGLGDTPLYYINLQKHANRRKYMEETFEASANAGLLTRVGATNGTNYRGILDKFRITEPEAFLQDPWGWLQRELHTTPAELGALISHLDAVKRAYQDRHEHVVIFEDDVGTQLCPYWPGSLDTITKQADLYYPGWHSVQLQWTPVGQQGHVIKDRWRNAVRGSDTHQQLERTIELERAINMDRGIGSESGGVWDEARLAEARLAERLALSYGAWPAEAIPLIGRVSSLHGNAATLWSRRGLKHLLFKYQESIVSRTRAGTAIRKWRADPDLPHTPDAILRQSEGAYSLFAAPPLFSQRLINDKSAIKNDLDWRRANLQGSLFALQWYMELQELYRPGAADRLPLRDFDFQVRS